MVVRKNQFSANNTKTIMRRSPLDGVYIIYIDISYFNIMHNTIINGSPERLKYHFIYYYFIVIINIIQSDRF